VGAEGEAGGLQVESNGVDIVMHTTGRWRYSRLAITELRNRTSFPYRLIVVDSGSGGGTQEILTELLQDGFISVLALLSSGGDGWQVGMALAETPLVLQVTDEWLPPGDDPDWLETLLAIAGGRPAYGVVALRPDFFTRGVPPLVRDGNLLMVPWTEVSFRCVRRGAAALRDKSGYVPHLRAEYLPAAALAWQYPG